MSMLLVPTMAGAIACALRNDPYFASVTFLCHFDASVSTTITCVVGSQSLSGGAVLSNTQVKWGAKSMYTGGSTSDFSSGSTQTLGSGDWTMEGWVYVTANNVTQGLLAIGHNSSSTNAIVYINSSGKLVYVSNNATVIAGTTTVTTNGWHYWMVRRQSGTTQLYLDGVQEGSNYTDARNYGGEVLWIGQDNTAGSGNTVRGYTDDVRITPGVARPVLIPSAAFPNF